MRALLVGLVLSCLLAMTGCGTALNIFPDRQNPHLYGGVENDCKALQATWTQRLPDEDNAPPPQRLGKALVLSSLIALDFPMCLVADTITLPHILLLTDFRGWDLFQGPPASPTDDAIPTVPVGPRIGPES